MFIILIYSCIHIIFILFFILYFNYFYYIMYVLFSTLSYLWKPLLSSFPSSPLNKLKQEPRNYHSILEYSNSNKIKKRKITAANSSPTRLSRLDPTIARPQSGPYWTLWHKLLYPKDHITTVEIKIFKLNGQDLSNTNSTFGAC